MWMGWDMMAEHLKPPALVRVVDQGQIKIVRAVAVELMVEMEVWVPAQLPEVLHTVPLPTRLRLVLVVELQMDILAETVEDLLSLQQVTQSRLMV